MAAAAACLRKRRRLAGWECFLGITGLGGVSPRLFGVREGWYESRLLALQHPTIPHLKIEIRGTRSHGPSGVDITRSGYGAGFVVGWAWAVCRIEGCAWAIYSLESLRCGDGFSDGEVEAALEVGAGESC